MRGNIHSIIESLNEASPYSNNYSIQDTLVILDSRNLEKEIASKFKKKYERVLSQYGKLDINVDIETSDLYDGLIENAASGMFLSISLSKNPDPKTSESNIKSILVRYKKVKFNYDKMEKAYYLSAETNDDVAEFLSCLEMDGINCSKMYDYKLRDDIERELDAKYYEDLEDRKYQMRDTRRGQ